MRKTIFLVCLIGTCLSSCAPKGHPEYRTREERPYPDPTEGTDNRESQWYKTQILASPSATTGQPAIAAPVSSAPAKKPKTPVPTHAAPPSTKIGATPNGI